MLEAHICNTFQHDCCKSRHVANRIRVLDTVEEVHIRQFRAPSSYVTFLYLAKNPVAAAVSLAFLVVFSLRLSFTLSTHNMRQNGEYHILILLRSPLSLYYAEGALLLLLLEQFYCDTFVLQNFMKKPGNASRDEVSRSHFSSAAPRSVKNLVL